jgi:hypothetical protein
MPPDRDATTAPATIAILIVRVRVTQWLTVRSPVGHPTAPERFTFRRRPEPPFEARSNPTSHPKRARY